MKHPQRRGALARQLGAAVVALACVATTARAGDLTVHVGPPSVGTGGTNPVSIPPINPLEYEVEYITDNDLEMNFAITPGILFGKRSELGNGRFYASFGGGLVLSANGSGPGIYSDFGVNLGESIQFNAEFKQALGVDVSTQSIISPYAVRLGVNFPL
jgi:hypothetical protein